jgi:hypothetical protein
MTRICDGHPGNKPCPRRNPCEGDCHFNTAGLKLESESLLSFSDRLLCWAIWGMVTVVLCLMIVPVVWLIGVLV